MNVAIELPKEIANNLAGPDEDLSRIALEALAAQGYRDGKLSHAEVQHVLGFTLGDGCVFEASWCPP